jgi:hypothetical protein
MHRVDAYEMVRRRTAEAGFKGKLVATCSAPNPTGKGGDYHEALKLARQTAISSSPRARVRARVFGRAFRLPGRLPRCACGDPESVVGEVTWS